MNLRKYNWILLIISGIFCILAVSIPTLYLINIENPQNSRYYWIFALYLKADGSIDFLNNYETTISLGFLGMTLLLIIALVFILSALLTKIKDVKIPGKEFIWLGLGILLFITPFLLQTLMGLMESSEGTLFGLQVNIFSPLIYAAGLLGIVVGLEEIRS